MRRGNDLIPFRKGKKWGYCDKELKIIIECKFDLAEEFKDGLAKVYKEVRSQECDYLLVGLIDSTGSFALEIKFRSIFNFSQNDSVLVLEELDRPIYYDSEYSERICLPHVFSKEKGFLNIFNYKGFDFEEAFSSINGLLFKDLFYSKVESYKSTDYNQIIRVSEKCSLGFRNSEESQYIKPYTSITSEFDLIDLSGQIIGIDELTDPNRLLLGLGLYAYSSPNNQVRINGKYGYVNKHGDIPIPFIYDSLSLFVYDIAAISFGGKFSLVNKGGRILLHFLYDELFYDEEICFWVGLKGCLKEVFQIKDSEVTILKKFEKGQGLYSEINHFDVISIKKDGENFYGLSSINRQLLPPIMSFYPETCFFYCLVELNDKYGLINIKGEFVISNKYIEINHIKKNFFILRSQEKFYLAKIQLNEEVERIELDFTGMKLQNLHNLYFTYNNSLDLISVKYYDAFIENVGFIDFKGKNYFSDGYFETYYPEEYFDNESDFGMSSNNPWDDVFGPGEEADDAHWNTRGE